jgi:hypothetical protein
MLCANIQRALYHVLIVCTEKHATLFFPRSMIWILILEAVTKLVHVLVPSHVI